MLISQVVIVKETRPGEGRVALTPEAAAEFISKHKIRVLIESNAGLNAGFSNEDYIKAGAEILELASKGFPPNSLILRVKRGTHERELLEKKLFHENTAMIGFLDPFISGNHIEEWRALGLTTFSHDLFKTLSTQDPKNAQAAMSRIAGRLAFRDALKRYKGQSPIKLTVLGTGPAAISAALEAKKQGITVQLFGRNERYRVEIESAGIIYHCLPTSSQAQYLQSFLKDQPIVIAAARVPKEKAPILIDDKNLAILPQGAIVVDLAVSEGGNVIGSKSDQVVTYKHVSIVNISGYPKAEPKEASEAFSSCMLSLLGEVLLLNGELLEDGLFSECWVTRKGQLNPFITDRMGKIRSKL